MIYLRRHWQALLVLTYFAWMQWREGFSSQIGMWIAAGLAIVGMAMNLVVNIANGGMPAAVKPEEIPDSEQPHYHAIGQSTRLGFLSDWIPVGTLLMSPGDILLVIAVAILLIDPFVGS